MKNEDLKKWKKYNDWVDGINRPVLEAVHKVNEDAMKKYDVRLKEYEKKDKLWRKNRDMKLKKINDWKMLPWYKRMKTDEPTITYGEQVARPFYPMFPVLMTPFVIKHASYEGYLNWLIEEEHLLKEDSKEAQAKEERKEKL